MKLNTYRTLTAILLTLLFASPHCYAQESYEVRVRRYVEQYKELAIQEQKRTGIPAAIKLAQGVLETQAGASELCLGAYNHFGIKCKKEWKGQTYTYTDDRPDECFRKYGCVNDSYTDHSEYLRTQPRYAGLFTLQITDYKGWAIGLKRCGYATSPTYTQQLIKIIETFNLQDYTIAGKGQAPVKVTYASYVDTPQKRKNEIVPEEDANPVDVSVEQPKYAYRTDGTVTVGNDMTRFANETGSFHANGFKAFYGHKGDVLLEQAIKYKVRYAHLLELNDLPDAPLEADMLVYLEKKNPKGLNEKHIVRDGETMLQVSQLEAIQLKQLRLLNMLDVNEEPAVGTVLQLRQMTTRKPSTRDRNAIVQKIEFPVAVTPVPKTTPVQSPLVEMETEVQVQEKTVVAKPDEADLNKIKKEEPVKAEQIVKETTTVAVLAPATDKEKEKIVAAKTIAIEKIITPKETIIKEEIVTPVASAESKEPTPFNIADEKAVEETDKVRERRLSNAEKHRQTAKTEAAEKTKTEPVSEFDKLKAQLDEVVFAEETKPVEEKQAAAAPKPNSKEAKANAREEARVKAKEASLAKLKGIKTKAIAKEEEDEEPEATEETQRLKEKKQVAKELKPAAKAKAKVTPVYYVVKKGDTGFGIAKKHGISMKQLKEWNKTDWEDMRPGQKILVKK